jgi:signal transduction histidine kinase/CheY-like chemotaxis protein
VEWSLSADVRPGVILAIATDISERVELSRQREELLKREQAARAAAESVSRSKDEFIAVLSHELRTPLNAIVGWVEILKRSADPPLIARGIEAIQRNAQVQTRLIADILDVSRVRLGKLPLEVESLDVLEVVNESIAALTASIEGKSLKVSVAAPPYLHPIVADSARLQQIVWNLLTNAIKFSSPNGPIRVLLSEDENYLTLVVEDEGQGIEPEFLPFIFDRFAQSDPFSNRRHGGLGLGLSIVKQLVSLHGGTVEAHSAGRDRGATLVVKLPRMADQTLGRDEAISQFNELDTGPQGRLMGLVVAIVEDDIDASEVLGAILRSESAKVLLADSYEAALALLEHEPTVDALIGDIGMPGRDGYDLIREIRRLEGTGGRRLPAIALTAFARPKDREMALAAGFDAHCAKPVRAAELITAVVRSVRK